MESIFDRIKWRLLKSINPSRYNILSKSNEFWIKEAPFEIGSNMGPIEKSFWDNREDAIDKWINYLPVYDRHLAEFRGKKVKMLEIGVQNGGSMRLWREFFGPEAVIFGVDINPACAKYDGIHGKIRIGSQDDGAFLREVVAEMGGLDIVLDDGSHIMKHIKASFDALFPLVAEGGLYMIEDLSCAYWSKFGGARGRKGTFIESVKSMIDDMHAWAHDGHINVTQAAGNVHALHIYDSIIAIEKRQNRPPMRYMSGSRAEVFGEKRLPETS